MFESLATEVTPGPSADATGELFRGTFESAAVGLAHVAADGRFLRVNRRLCEIVGYSADELCGRTFMEITHPDDLAADLQGKRRLETGDVAHFSMEKRFLRRDGSPVWVRLTASVLDADSPREERFIAVFEDIEPVRAAEAWLRRSEAWFRRIFADAPSGMAITTRDGRFVQCNAAYERILGYSEEELRRMSFGALVHPDDRDANLELTDRLLTGELPEFVLENRYIRRDGGTVWVRKHVSLLPDESLAPRFVVALVEDITERRRDGDARRRQADLLDQAHEAIIVWEIGGRIVYWSRGAEELYGWRASEAVGRVSHELLDTTHPLPVEQVESDIAESGRWFGEVRHRTRDGRIVLVDSRQVRVTYDGHPFVLETNRDVTERTVAEEALRVHTARLEEALRAKDEFLGLVSHELKTPVTTILGSAAVLQRRLQDDDGLLTDLTAEASRLARIIDNLLILARIENGRGGETEPVLLDRLVAEVAENVRREFVGREIRCRGASEVVVEANPGQLAMVIRNYVVNALKYSSWDRPVEVAVVAEDGRGGVDVIDEGAGIAEPDPMVLFEPFYRSRSTASVSGIGIGLTVCRRVIESLGGTVSATRREGDRGSVFSFRLPLATDE